MSRNVWFTYAWKDNENNDVDFYIQELRGKGLNIKIDRWNLVAGKRLWDQIGDQITKASECDAWIFYATPNSMYSEPCREELAYALGRALSVRGDKFPIIVLADREIDKDIMPPSITSRLFINMDDPDWKERAVAGAEQRAPNISQKLIAPYQFIQHEQSLGVPVFEMRPRVGVWCPTVVGIPIGEKSKVNPSIMFGPRGVLNSGSVMFGVTKGPSHCGEWYLITSSNETNARVSVFLRCQTKPSKILFGQLSAPCQIIDIG